MGRAVFDGRRLFYVQGIVFSSRFAPSGYNPENLPLRHPQESGGSFKFLINMDSRCLGNDEL